MKPGILEPLIKLQLFFREKMGELYGLDHADCLGENSINVIMDCDYSCPDNQRKYCPDRLLIPLTIDPINFERGLLGMCRDISAIRPVYNLDGSINCWSIEIEPGDTKTHEYRADTPTEAILKALVAQEGKK